jgi:GNAT superfamily N-acetyltransferase
LIGGQVINIRLMTEADIALGMRLKEQAGWNQVEADWRRFLAISPEGCFVAQCNGKAVGTVVGCLFGSVAWIAMVLVDSRARGRGIGKALVEHVLSFVDQHGATSLRLDATSLGQPLYERLGFVPQYPLMRFGGTLSFDAPLADVGIDSDIIQAAEIDYAAILKLDQLITGTDRRTFLHALFNEGRKAVRIINRDREIKGYLTVRPGSDALQIGPCIATADAGKVLLADAAHRYAGQRIYVDVPASNRAAVHFAEQMGLAVQRTLTRMCRGVDVVEDTSRLWASSGPELG